MKNTNLFTAPNICLTALDAVADAKRFATWTHDSRFIPLIEDDSPTHPLSEAQAKKLLDEILKEADEDRTTFWFGIRTLDKSELLGIATLHWIDWGNGAVYMDITMKNLEEYGKTSTKEALELLQNYVFYEIHMHRLSISIPAYNTGLIESLQNTGFIEEVRRREAIFRFDKRWDSIHFGILASDWKEKNDSNKLHR